MPELNPTESAPMSEKGQLWQPLATVTVLRKPLKLRTADALAVFPNHTLRPNESGRMVDDLLFNR